MKRAEGANSSDIDYWLDFFHITFTSGNNSVLSSPPPPPPRTPNCFILFLLFHDVPNVMIIFCPATQSTASEVANEWNHHYLSMPKLLLTPHFLQRGEFAVSAIKPWIAEKKRMKMKMIFENEFDKKALIQKFTKFVRRDTFSNAFERILWGNSKGGSLHFQTNLAQNKHN